MPTYEVAGLVLVTDVELPELTPTDAARPPSWSLARADALPSGTPVAWHDVHADTGPRFARVEARDDATFRLLFDGSVDVVIDPAERTVAYVPVAGVADSTLQHLLVDQVVPHLLVAGGELALHASAVGLDGRAVAFVGASGAGKSSLAAALVQRGGTLLCDDYLLLREAGDGYVATPAYPGLRLWGDSAAHFAGSVEDLPPVSGSTDKRRWRPPTDAQDRDLPLQAIVVLGHQAGAEEPVCKVGRIGGQSAFGVLLPQVFRLPHRGTHDRRELDRMGALASQVPVLLLEFRRDYAVLPEVLGVLTDAVARAGELEILAPVHEGS